MSSRKFRVTVDGEIYEIEVEFTDVDSELELLKKLFTKSKIREVERKELVPRYSDRIVTAPMTGKILSLNVKYGSEVKEDTVVAVLESMKTQVEITAGKSGRVKRILVTEGDVVKQGQAILELD